MLMLLVEDHIEFTAPYNHFARYSIDFLRHEKFMITFF